MLKRLLLTGCFGLLCLSAAGVTLSEGTVDYGGPTRVDRTDSTRTHDDEGDYVTIEAGAGIILAGTPADTEYLIRALDVGVGQRLGLQRTSILSSDATQMDLGESGTSTGYLIIHDGGSPARLQIGDLTVMQNYAVAGEYLFQDDSSSDRTFNFENGGSGDSIVTADQVHHAAPLKALQYDYIVEVSPDGDDDDADDGIGPYATISAALSKANSLASSADRVLVYLHPGTYGSSDSVTDTSGIGIPDGVSLSGAGIGVTQLINFYITIQTTDGVYTKGQQLIGNFTWTGIGNESGISHAFVSSSGLVDWTQYQNVLFKNIHIESDWPFEEGLYDGMVSVFRATKEGSDLDWTFQNVTYTGKSIFLLDGHPSVGSLDAIRNVTMENCYIEMKPDNAGPADPHFPILHYSPGKKNYRNTTIISDLSASTNTGNTHGIVLVTANNSNDYPSGEITEATATNCTFIMYDSGTGTNQYALQVNADADRSAHFNVYNSTLLVEDDFDYQVVVAGAGDPEFNWLNTNIDAARISESGNGEAGQLSSGTGLFTDSSIIGELTVKDADAITQDGTLNLGTTPAGGVGAVVEYDAAGALSLETSDTVVAKASQLYLQNPSGDGTLTFEKTSGTASLTYDKTDDEFQFSENLDVTGNLDVSGSVDTDTLNLGDAAIEWDSTGEYVQSDKTVIVGKTLIAEAVVYSQPAPPDQYIDAVDESFIPGTLPLHSSYEGYYVTFTSGTESGQSYDIVRVASGHWGVKIYYIEIDGTVSVEGDSYEVHYVQQEVFKVDLSDHEASVQYNEDTGWLSVPGQTDASGNKKQVTYHGTLSITNSESSVTFASAGFPTPFASAPTIVLTPVANRTTPPYAWVKTKSTTGFTARAGIWNDPFTWDNTTASVTVDWVAMGYVE
jgi:hypothetical protein